LSSHPPFNPQVSISRAFDYFSRQAAIDKLHAMSIQIGTPDIIRDRKFLKILYKDLLVQKTDFFQNIQYGMHFLRRRQEHALISPGEETRWLAALLADRVTYVPAANKVVVPEYLLAPPLFHPRYAPQVNLGGLGVMIAEAVVEAVAGTGLVFTANGQILDGQAVAKAGRAANLTSIASRAAAAAIEPSAVLQGPASCLLTKWSAMGLDTPDQLAKAAVGGAVAVGGLEAAYTALTESLLVEGGQLLPALERLDPQSVFFVQYAQTFCAVSTLAQRDLDRTLGRDLLGREKLKGVLSQFAEFRHFFFCSERNEDMCGPVL
jgi:predicted metalloendopeptidase